MKRWMRYLPLVFLIPVLVMVGFWWAREPYTGFIRDPVQTDLGGGQKVNITGEEGYVALTLLARYDIEAVVKSKNSQSDYPAQISKYDLALAWGTLNDAGIDSHITYGQTGRYYFYNWSEGTPVSPDYIARHSANVHLIHSSDRVLQQIRSIDKKDHVRLQGFLVNVNFKNGSWNTSLTRNDTGNGSCEIMYVTQVDSLD
jgi:hypothetical protein